MSLRGRLALLVVGAVALGLAVVSVTTYLFLSRRLHDEVDQLLVTRTRAVTLGTFVFPRTGSVVIPFNNLGDATTFVQVVDLEGTVQAHTSNLGEISIPVDARTLAVAHDRVARARTVAAGSTRLRILESPLTASSRPPGGPGRPASGGGEASLVGVVQVGRSLADTESGLRNVRTILVAGDLGTLLLAGLVAGLLTRTALRPLAAMRTSAEQVAATGDPARRLRPDASGDDEVARLAAAFDRMLDRLAASGAALSAALDSQRRFVADASHELRTPITSARGNLEVVLRNPDMSPADREQAVSEAAAELERMGRLVDGLLTLARADSGRPFASEPVSLRGVIERSHRHALARAGGRRLLLDDRLGDVEVTGSADLLSRLFDNLYDNAIKYTGDDGTIVVSSAVDGGWATVSVADNGPGIDPAELPHIFERFYRSPGARGTEGSGLGLAIVHWAALMHGGTVSVSSTPGLGTTFVVRLPTAP